MKLNNLFCLRVSSCVAGKGDKNSENQVSESMKMAEQRRDPQPAKPMDPWLTEKERRETPTPWRSPLDAATKQQNKTDVQAHARAPLPPVIGKPPPKEELIPPPPKKKAKKIEEEIVPTKPPEGYLRKRWAQMRGSMYRRIKRLKKRRRRWGRTNRFRASHHLPKRRKKCDQRGNR